VERARGGRGCARTQWARDDVAADMTADVTADVTADETVDVTADARPADVA
jgi:hypothetical protein